ARTAVPLVAERCRIGADVSAGAAVVRVRVQEGACPIAGGGAVDAGVDAVAVDARAVLVGAGRRTHVAARAAVGDVNGQIGAVVAAAGAAEAAGVAVARPAGCKASVLLALITASTECLARVFPSGGLVPGGRRGGPQRAEEGAGQNGAEASQGLAA